MELKIREIQICGQPGYAFTDDTSPQIAIYTEGGFADETEIVVSHDCETDWHHVGKGDIYFNYQGKPLLPHTTYLVRVSVRRTISGSKAEASEMEARFDTGFLGNGWQASWIEPVQEAAVREPEILFYQIFNPATWGSLQEEKLRPVQEIRKTFFLEKCPLQAVLYATARGVYEVYVNGKRPDTRRMAPEISVYPKRLYYQRYEITELLQEGENELRFLLADGWWSGRIGLSGDSCQYGERLALLAQAELWEQGKTTQGEPMVLCTDETFECRESQIRYADLYIGEKWDLTMLPQEWKRCRSAEQAAGSRCLIPDEALRTKSNLVAQPIRPLAVLDSLKGTLMRTPKGDLIADFGQTMAGTVRLQLNAQGRREIVLEHCEALDENGEFFQNIVGRNKQQRDALICDSWPVEFAPRFTYHGFRYVRITGVTEDEIESIYADVVGTPLSYIGEFSCSEEALNQLDHNIRWSMQSNFVSIPTDCPQREKMGWTGDIQIFTPTAACYADVRGFLKGWLANMREEQRPDGEIPNYVPAFPINDQIQRNAQKRKDNTSAAWGDSCVLVPLYLYRKTGDLSILEENLEMMERWLGFIENARKILPENYESMTEEEKARCPYLWRSGHQYGDWLIPSFMKQKNGMALGRAATAEVISSSFYAVTLGAYIEVLDALLSDKNKEVQEEQEGKQALLEKRSQTSRLLEQIRSAVREEYISEDGTVKGNLQGLYVIMLYAGIVTGELGQKVAKKLSELIRSNGTRLDTGFVTTPYLLDVLCDNGYTDLAYELLYQMEPPSWLYQVKQGATTIWESWMAVLSDGHPTDSSMNHYSLGSVGDWIYRHIGGIQIDHAMRDGILIMPDTDREVSWAKTALKLPFGTVSCSWKREKEQVRMEIETPAKCQVRLGTEQTDLAPGKYQIRKQKGSAKLCVEKIGQM
ncbi:MAG: glycoside hydrolase family 78 protein [Clostridiales bacterium]|nr:glycoside hydrolase family 78 protein [Clostridiales bacterium]